MLTFADVSYTPQEECCFEINNTLKQQNDILAQFLNKKDTLLADKTGNNKNSITINNNCCNQQADNFDFIDFIAQIATIIGLLFAILTYWWTEKNKRNEIIRAYKALTKYFYDRVISLTAYIDRQGDHFTHFIDNIKKQPYELQNLKFESNSDAARIEKIESEKLYESVSYLNRPYVIDNDYYNLLYGAGYIKELESQSKNVYITYLHETRILQGKLEDIITSTKEFFIREESNLSTALKTQKNNLSNISGNLNIFYLNFYMMTFKSLKAKKRDKQENELLLIVLSYEEKYADLINTSNAFKLQFEQLGSKYSETAKNMKIYKGNLRLKE